MKSLNKISDSHNPKVSIIMPVYNGEKYLKEAIESILAQTFTDWEFIIINEFGTVDRSQEIIESYVAMDERIRFIQNEERLGLADSLNYGFRIAKGKYLARMDADDLAHLKRIERQVDLMEKNQEIGICGTYQHHFGDVDWVHKPPITPEMCKASLIFNCDICHSTLMLRREVVLNYNLFYDKKYLAEDYELWTRAAKVTSFINIPEILGEYRWDGDNITAAKKKKLNIESGYIVAKNIIDNFNMFIPENKYFYFQGWENPFNKFSGEKRNELLNDFESILKEMYYQNLKLKIFNNEALLKCIAKKWFWVKFNAPWDKDHEVYCLDQIFVENYKRSFFMRLKVFWKKNKTLKSKVQKFVKVTLRWFFKPVIEFFNSKFLTVESSLKEYVEWKTWDRYQRLSKEITLLKTDFDNSKYGIIAEINQSIDARVSEAAMLINQNIDARVSEAAELINQSIDARVSEAAMLINQSIDARVWDAEKLINQTIDARVWDAEKLINQTIDARVWDAEKLINQTIDARVWDAEKLINQTIDARVWDAEKLINQTIDARVWDAEKLINQTIDARVWDAEKNILQNNTTIRNEIHRHIDFIYRDLMIVLERYIHFVKKEDVILRTDYLIAYKSNDHIVPHGTMRDNTRYPRFVKKCEQILKNKREISFLDLGCSGGGMVLEAALRGHFSIGLEGSDYSLKQQRAEWRLLGSNLQTCDITKPFEIIDQSTHNCYQFDIITAWEVLEHIEEKDLPQTFSNIKNHLSNEGLFVASIANWDDIDEETGVNWHVTTKPFVWWKEIFEQNGFTVCFEIFDTIDLARGGYNPPHCYETMDFNIDREKNFYIVVKC